MEGVGLIVGIDRFMSEARAVTNFSGNAVATLLVGTWTKSIDRDQVDKVLAGHAPFDETTMLDEHDLDDNPDTTDHLRTGPRQSPEDSPRSDQVLARAPRARSCTRAGPDIGWRTASARVGSPIVAHRPQPEQQAPPVQRLRVKYAKRGRARFTSHRDFGRAFERALRRAGVPMAYSSGFSPHPRISYANASPTGAASEAEYLEIGLAEICDPEQVRAALDAALPPGLDIVEVVTGLPVRWPTC